MIDFVYHVHVMYVVINNLDLCLANKSHKAKLWNESLVNVHLEFKKKIVGGEGGH